MTECRVYHHKPAGFEVQVEVAGCFCLFEKKLLLLKRHESRPQGGTWNIPAGKMEKGEGPYETVLREVYEEAGIELGPVVRPVGTLYIAIPNCNYAFHMFYQKFDSEPTIRLDESEQVKARWLTLDDALHLSLIAGGKEALAFFRTWTGNLNRM